jgi:aryl-alcohol dehydrogenase-like predicted oxidoreductase
MNLIREIRLPNGRRTLNLGFGCAGLLRLPTAGQRRRLLESAFDAGLTHFDVARSYGAGAAEGIVGQCFAGRRGEITLATKFGFPCGVPSQRTVLVQSLGRWAVNLHPALKRLAKKQTAPGGDRPYDYSVAEMERSLETSLRELRTDALDLFFVHEPRLDDEVPEVLAAALRRRHEEGRFGAYGVSGPAADLLYFQKVFPGLFGGANQHNFSFDDIPPALAQMTHHGVFHVLAGTLPSCEASLRANPEVTKTFSEKLGLDLTQRENLAAAIVAVALNVQPHGMVLFFTTRARRIAPLVKRLRENSFTPEALEEFRRVLRGRENPDAH